MSALRALLDERLDIADDRGERGAQLVAGIGDEVGMRAADVGLGGAVDQFDEPVASVDRLPGHLPGTARPGQALNRHAAALLAPEQIDRRRVAESDARILADDMPAENLARLGVGDHDAAVVEQQERDAGVLDQLAHPVAGQLHVALGSGNALGRRDEEKDRPDPDDHHAERQKDIDAFEQQHRAGSQRQPYPGPRNRTGLVHRGGALDTPCRGRQPTCRKSVMRW